MNYSGITSLGITSLGITSLDKLIQQSLHNLPAP